MLNALFLISFISLSIHRSDLVVGRAVDCIYISMSGDLTAYSIGLQMHIVIDAVKAEILYSTSRPYKSFGERSDITIRRWTFISI